MLTHKKESNLVYGPFQDEQKLAWLRTGICYFTTPTQIQGNSIKSFSL